MSSSEAKEGHFQHIPPCNSRHDVSAALSLGAFATPKSPKCQDFSRNGCRFPVSFVHVRSLRSLTHLDGLEVLAGLAWVSWGPQTRVTDRILEAEG